MLTIVALTFLWGASSPEEGWSKLMVPAGLRGSDKWRTQYHEWHGPEWDRVEAIALSRPLSPLAPRPRSTRVGKDRLLFAVVHDPKRKGGTIAHIRRSSPGQIDLTSGHPRGCLVTKNRDEENQRFCNVRGPSPVRVGAPICGCVFLILFSSSGWQAATSSIPTIRRRPFRPGPSRPARSGPRSGFLRSPTAARLARRTAARGGW